ncbi:ATP-binding protein [Cellulomonas sp. McL0617]|uniref:ATP-binding protein n=1 Tax=Cellulomonas sp. McL0617 TaxID=3415675 RepID=UPI003CF22460
MGDVRDLRSAASARRADAHVVDAQLVVEAERSAPRTARHWVMRAIAEAGVGGSANQVVELLTGELVANAVVHGPPDRSVTVRVRIDATVVRVMVSDAGGGVPTVGHPEPTAPSGRGLALVEALSSDWGTLGRPDGKTVWFEVPADD